MKRTSFSIALVLAILLGAIVPTIADGQPPGYGVNATGTTIGFIEKFALADDRTIAMQELIPGSHDYFY
jgi:hypothetical protein